MEPRENRIAHPIDPVWDDRSQLLILGSFPSVASRGVGFFYGHPQNRFWRVLEGVFGDPIPGDTVGKRDWLLGHHIALWDVIASCEITGSSDASVRGEIPNDLSRILAESRIRRIYVNGRLAQKLYEKHMEPVYGYKAHYLPSTSPANAAFDMEKLMAAWRVLRREVPDKEHT